jgi:hypothetical protein
MFDGRIVTFVQNVKKRTYTAKFDVGVARWELKPYPTLIKRRKRVLFTIHTPPTAQGAQMIIAEGDEADALTAFVERVFQTGSAPTSGAASPRAFRTADAELEGGDSVATGTVERLSLAEILATGAPARVVIVESEVLSPPMNDKAGNPVYRFLVTVVRDGADPYRWNLGQGVAPDALPFIYPGANLPAKVADAEHVAIDWDAAQNQAATGRP